MEHITKLLEKLAEQLGTTVEFLWGVLLKQARVESGIALIGIIVGVILIIIAAVLLWHGYKLHLKNVDKSYSEKSDPSGWFFAGGIFFVISAITMGFNIYNYILTTYNPEYWALNEILKLLR